MSYKFELTKEPTQAVLSIRTRTTVDNLPQQIGKAYGIILEYLKEIGEKPQEAPFVAYYNMDMQDLDVEMGFPITKPLEGKGEIKANEIPAGKRVSCMHKGPYKEMEPVYNAMMQWMKEKGHTPTGEAYEFYYNSPIDVPESELLTKIVFPIE